MAASVTTTSFRLLTRMRATAEYIGGLRIGEGARAGHPFEVLLWALRRFGDNSDRVCRGSAVAELFGGWPIRAVCVPINRRWLDRGGDSRGDARVPEPA